MSRKYRGQQTLTPEAVIRKRRLRIRNRGEILSFVWRLCFMAVFIYVLLWRMFGVTLVKTDDMKPRVSGGDLLFYYRLNQEYHLDDVLVFDAAGEERIGRLIAVGGDLVEVSMDGVLSINDNTIIEDDIFYATMPYQGGINFPVKLAQDEVFVLCDFREGGKDSRYFGPVRLSQIKGSAIFVIRRGDL